MAPVSFLLLVVGFAPCAGATEAAEAEDQGPVAGESTYKMTPEGIPSRAVKPQKTPRLDVYLRHRSARPRPASRPPSAVRVVAPATARDTGVPRPGQVLQGRAPVIREFNFAETPLQGVIDWFREAAQIPIFVNWRELETWDIDRSSPVSLQLKGVSLGKALDLVLESVGGDTKLDYTIEDGVVKIGSREYLEKKLITKVYYVGDLLVRIPSFTDAPGFSLSQATEGSSGGSSNSNIFEDTDEGDEEEDLTRAERAEGLMAIIMATIEPESWQDSGGRGTIRFWRDYIIVRNHYFVHEQLGGGL